MVQKVISFSIIVNNKLQNELKNIINIPQSYPINKDMFNLEKCFGEINNSYLEKNSINNSSSSNNNNIKFKTHIFDLQTNNEIKVLKNNKIVYINKDLLNNYRISKNIKKLKNVNFIIRKKRSSKYRGVSKNGSKWQVLIMKNNKKFYLGNYLSEELAARIYDIQAIKSWGIKAKTNFVYNKNQLNNIYNKKINIKCNDISDIIAQINN